MSWFVFAATLAVSVAALTGLWFGMESPHSAVPATQQEVEEIPVDAAREETKLAAETQNKNVSVTQIDSVDTARDPIPLSELDLSVRSRLPDLAINALSYSPNQEKRFVMINQDIFKEGEDLGNGIVVEEIKKSSVVLSFEGRQFILRPF